LSADLIYRLNNKDEAAFKEVFHLFYPKMGGYLFNHGVFNHDDQATIISNIFVSLWRGIKKGQQIEDVDHLRNILFAANRKKLIQFNILARGPKKRLFCYVEDIERYDVEEENTPVGLNFINAMCRVKRAMNTLPPQCQAIFKMYTVDNMSYADIAVKLNISPQTARNQKPRAIQLIKQKLKL
jgi:RNA polymerase sigma-70 factor (ECF subfamily)